jgi:hypothetical protein
MSIDNECALIDHIAGDIVNDGWITWQKYADEAVNATSGFFDDLSEISLTPIRTDIDFPSIPEGLGTPFAKPDAPDEPDLTFSSPNKPGGVIVPSVVAPDFGTAPTLDATPPDVAAIPAPGGLTAVAPEGPPDSVDIVIPDAPVITLPDEPTLESITLPAVPTTTLPTFDGVAPTLDLDAPDNTFSYTYEDYNEQMPTLIAKVNEMMAGGTGLPDAIWDALWEKARTREDITGSKLVQELTDDWASRGFSLPGGVLDKKITAARQEVQDASNTLSREIAIQQAQMEVENIRFAVAQGVAIENMYIGLHNQKMQILLEAAKYAIDASINIFNAQIAYQNIQLQTYLADVQVYRLLIEAEMAEIEIYKAQLEGQKLVGDINQQYITLYTSRVQALLTQIEIYKGQLDGVNALVEVNKNEIDAFVAQVQAFTAEVGAKETEVKLFAERVRAEESKVNIYKTEVDAFASLVEAYKSGNDSLIQQSQLEIQNSTLLIDQHKARVQQYGVEVDAEAKRIAAGVDIYNGQAQIYSAELSAEQARIIADSRQFELALEEGKISTDVELKEAQLNIEQMLRLLTLDIEKSKTIMTVQAQLAAAAMTAVNLSASVSEAVQNSSSCSTTTTTEI